jgi:hypothetical protein
MNVKCPKCRFKFEVTAPPEGGSVEFVCPRCGTKFTHDFPVPEKPAPEQAPEETQVAPVELTPEQPVQQPVQQPVEGAPEAGQTVYYYEEPGGGGKRSKALWIILGVALGIVILAAAAFLLPDLLTGKSSEPQTAPMDTTAVAGGGAEATDPEETIKNEIESMWGSNEALTPEFRQLIKEDEKLCASTGDIYCIDYDLWTQSQENVLEHQVVQVTDITETSATAYARIKDYGGTTRTNKLMLVKINGKWLVDEIIHDGYYEKKQLAQCLKEAKQAPMESGVTKVYVNGVNVRLRTSPEISDYNIITDGYGKNLHPNKGERLEYLGEAGDFYYIRFRGIEAYISKQFSYLVTE